MMRGEDVSLLQRRLSTLGFDSGRIDGIFGPDTLGGLSDFQRNVGLLTDGICGPATIEELDRFGRRLDESPIAVLREQESIRNAPRDPAAASVAIGEPGGLAALAAALRRRSVNKGSSVLVIHHPEGSAIARQANRFGADVLISLAVSTSEPEISYFEVPGFVSVGGRGLARLVAEELSPVVGCDVRLTGRRGPVLRESRMPAVTLRLPLTTLRGDRLPHIGQAWAQAQTTWATHRDDLVHN